MDISVGCEEIRCVVRFKEGRTMRILLFAGSVQWQNFQGLEFRTSAKLDIGERNIRQLWKLNPSIYSHSEGKIVEKVIVNVSTGLILRITSYMGLILIIAHQGISGK